jgi:hypothetical protein
MKVAADVMVPEADGVDEEDADAGIVPDGVADGERVAVGVSVDCTTVHGRQPSGRALIIMRPLAPSAPAPPPGRGVSSKFPRMLSAR